MTFDRWAVVCGQIARGWGCVILLAAGATFVAAQAAEAADDGSFYGHGEEGGFELGASNDEPMASAQGDAPATTVQYARLSDQMCGIADGDGGAVSVLCANPGVSDVVCAEGETRLDPLFRRTWNDGAWGDWELVEGPSCGVDAADLAAAAAREFRRVAVARPVLHVQPAASALVNKPVIVFADADRQAFDVELLGQAVELEASPVGYSWSFGDGSAPVSTTSPGHGYPDQDVTHTYAHAGGVQVAVTTRWSGRFRLRGAADWTAIEGEVSTTSQAVGLEVVEARTHLVEDTTD